MGLGAMASRLPRAAILGSGQYRAQVLAVRSPTSTHRPVHDDATQRQAERKAGRELLASLFGPAKTKSRTSTDAVDSQPQRPGAQDDDKLDRHPNLSESERGEPKWKMSSRRLFFQPKARTPSARMARPRRPDPSHVPFEDGHGVDDVPTSKAKTLTETERQLFASIEEKYQRRRVREAVQVADKASRREDARLNAGSVLDEILQDAVKENHRARRPAYPNPSPIDAADDTVTAVKTSAQIAAEALYNTAMDVLDSAKSDAKLWTMLHKHVMDPVLALKLDAPPTPKDTDTTDGAKQRDSTTRQALETHGQILPRLLVSTAQMFRRKFPHSHYLAAIIPALKSAGPSVYALGASTELYNALLSHMFDIECDLPAMLELLRDMEQNIINPDGETIAILQRCQDHALKCRRGSYGVAVATTWQRGAYGRVEKALRLRKANFEAKRNEMAERRMAGLTSHHDDQTVSPLPY